ncbi:hypothetical protein J2X19_003973 [Rhodoferax ferrireducens]|uniref:Uncharacterized protein n=1 Tax=Rhodoferax ferrireducens TaxID=192843 RepID=A0ABU2CD77_9BURK|nr:hypothetical protein [Rhodoferax ferrireducens]MDR7379279.1 hypothetical protein [Rhodoferax ferrireducens]
MRNIAEDTITFMTSLVQHLHSGRWAVILTQACIRETLSARPPSVVNCDFARHPAKATQ